MAKKKPFLKPPSIARSRRPAVTRAEFDQLIDLLNERTRVINSIGEQVERNTRNLETQFTRVAQIQAELDRLKRQN